MQENANGLMLYLKLFHDDSCQTKIELQMPTDIFCFSDSLIIALAYFSFLNKMVQSTQKISLRRAALIAGIGYILMFGTPIAEFMVYQKLVDFSNAAGTVHNIN